MRRASFIAFLLFALAPVLVGCGDGNGPTDTGPTPTYDLTFTGDETFQGAHGGQTLHVGVRNQATGELVASDQGPVSATAVPSFSFTFEDVLVEGRSYDLEYWIDSNFGGGTEGECDSPDVDHQWRIAVSQVSGSVTVEDTHRPGDTQNVCGGGNGGTDPGY